MSIPPLNNWTVHNLKRVPVFSRWTYTHRLFCFQSCVVFVREAVCCKQYEIVYVPVIFLLLFFSLSQRRVREWWLMDRLALALYVYRFPYCLVGNCKLSGPLSGFSILCLCLKWVCWPESIHLHFFPSKSSPYFLTALVFATKEKKRGRWNSISRKKGTLKFNLTKAGRWNSITSQNRPSKFY